MVKDHAAGGGAAVNYRTGDESLPGDKSPKPGHLCPG